MVVLQSLENALYFLPFFKEMLQETHFCVCQIISRPLLTYSEQFEIRCSVICLFPVRQCKRRQFLRWQFSQLGQCKRLLCCQRWEICDNYGFSRFVAVWARPCGFGGDFLANSFAKTPQALFRPLRLAKSGFWFLRPPGSFESPNEALQLTAQ